MTTVCAKCNGEGEYAPSKTFPDQKVKCECQTPYELDIDVLDEYPTAELKPTGGYKRKIFELFSDLPNESECDAANILYRLQYIMDKFLESQLTALREENDRLKKEVATLKGIPDLSKP